MLIKEQRIYMTASELKEATNCTNAKQVAIKLNITLQNVSKIKQRGLSFSQYAKYFGAQELARLIIDKEIE